MTKQPDFLSGGIGFLAGAFLTYMLTNNDAGGCGCHPQGAMQLISPQLPAGFPVNGQAPKQLGPAVDLSEDGTMGSYMSIEEPAPAGWCPRVRSFYNRAERRWYSCFVCSDGSGWCAPDTPTG